MRYEKQELQRPALEQKECRDPAIIIFMIRLKKQCMLPLYHPVTAFPPAENVVKSPDPQLLLSRLRQVSL